MFQEAFFTFDGRSSDEFGVILARTDSGMPNRPFGMNREVISEQTTDSPFLFDFGFNKETLQGEMTIAGRDTRLDSTRLSRIAKWLYQDDYKPLISNDYPDVILYVKFVNEHDIYFGMNDEGYITLSFIANSPWAWTRPYDQTFDLRRPNSSNTDNELEVVIDNGGNETSYNGMTVYMTLPESKVEKKVKGEAARTITPRFSEKYSICNLRNSSETDAFVISDYYVGDKKVNGYELRRGETIYIDMGKGVVESDGVNDPRPNRIANCNKKWITLMQGENRLRLKGNAKFTIHCQFPVLI